VHNVFISPWFGGAERNVLLQNNVGGKVVAGYYGFRVAAGNETCGNIVFRYNSATSPYSIECGRIRGKVQLTANVGPYTSFACDSRFVYAYNVFDGARCGATDRNAPSGFVDPHTSNLHLTDRSAAIGHGDPRSFPATDIDGRKRTARRVDAGAYQPG